MVGAKEHNAWTEIEVTGAAHTGVTRQTTHRTRTRKKLFFPPFLRTPPLTHAHTTVGQTWHKQLRKGGGARSPNVFFHYIYYEDTHTHTHVQHTPRDAVANPSLVLTTSTECLYEENNKKR